MNEDHFKGELMLLLRNILYILLLGFNAFVDQQLDQDDFWSEQQLIEVLEKMSVLFRLY